MTEAVELLVRGGLIGAGGAAVMDTWALLARRAFNVQGLDYALLGRWIGYFPVVASSTTASLPPTRFAANVRLVGRPTTPSGSRSRSWHAGTSNLHRTLLQGRRDGRVRGFPIAQHADSRVA